MKKFRVATVTVVITVFAMLVVMNLIHENITAQGTYNYTLGIRSNLLLDTSIARSHSFTTTALTDTMYIPGVLATDIVVGALVNDSVSTGFSVNAISGAVVAMRKGSGKSGATWNMIRVRNF